MAPMASGFVEDPAPTAAPGFVEDTPAAPADDRGFLARAWDDIASVPGTIKANLAEAGHSIASTAKKTFTHPLERLKEIPGEVAGVIRGAGHVANNAVDAASQGYFKAARDLAGSKIAPEATAANQAEEARFRAENPFLAGTGDAIGTVAGPVNKVAGAVAEKAVSPLAGAFEKAIGGKLVSAASKVPLAGPALATAAEGIGGAAKGIAGYEATAPLISAASAGAEGHRLEAAEAAAKDPAGLILSGAAEAIPAVAKKTAGDLADYAKNAQHAADNWVVKDILGQSKGETNATARKYLAADEADVLHTVKSDPELAGALETARHSDKDALQAAADVVNQKRAEIISPKAELYEKHVDQALGGGVRSGDVIGKLREAAEKHRESGTGGGHKMAAELDRQADILEKSKAWGFEDKIELPPEIESQVAMLRKGMARETDPANAAAIKQRIDELQAGGKKVRTFNPDKVVPTAVLRGVVSDVQSSAYDGLGGLASTKSNVQSRIVAGDAKKILDGYLDEAAKKVPDAVTQIREMNRKYSALQNIKAVIDQRLGKAIENATGASTPASLTHGLKSMAAHAGPIPAAAVLYGTGHPAAAAGVLAAAAAPVIKRVIDKSTARFASTPTGQRVIAGLIHAAGSNGNVMAAMERAIAAGVPPRVAQRIADISRQTFAGQSRDTTAEASP